MVVQMQRQIEVTQRAETVASLDRPDLFEVIAKVAPATVYGVAREALIPRFEALKWLTKQTEAGYLVRDQSTGRYAPWVTLHQPLD